MKVGIEPAPRIIFSAASLSSRVEMPGATIARKDSRTSAISSPTARIFSMSFCDFAMIIRFPKTNRKIFVPDITGKCYDRDLLKQCRDLLENILNTACTVNLFQPATVLIILEQWLRLFVECFQSRQNARFVIVRTVNKLGVRMQITTILDL